MCFRCDQPDHPTRRVGAAKIRIQSRRHQRQNQESNSAVRHGQAGILSTVQCAEETDDSEGVLPQGELRALFNAKILRLRGSREEVLEKCHLHPADLR